MIAGTKYSDDTTFTIEAGTIITCVFANESEYHSVVVDGQNVSQGSAPYSFPVESNLNIDIGGMGASLISFGITTS